MRCKNRLFVWALTVGAVVAPGMVNAAETVTADSAHPHSFPLPFDSPGFLMLKRNGQFLYHDTLSQYSAYSPDNNEHSWRFFDANNVDDLAERWNTRYAAYDGNSLSGPQRYEYIEKPLYDQAAQTNTTGYCDGSRFVQSIMPPKRASDGKAISGYDYNNFCGLMGTWIDPDTGDWYGLIHEELFGNVPRYDAIEYARSTDQGQSWTLLGPIITSPFGMTGKYHYAEAGNPASDVVTRSPAEYGFPEQTYYYGDGDPRLVTDYASGYFYMFYTSRILNQSGSSGFNNGMWLHVARAPIADKMKPSSWQKYADGRWQALQRTPAQWRALGNNGAEANIVPVSDNARGYAALTYDPQRAGRMDDIGYTNSALRVMNVSWNAYLGEYIGTPEHRSGASNSGKSPTPLYATRDLASQKWHKIGDLADYRTASWYRSLVDPVNGTSNSVLGKHFRLYCTFYCSTYSGEYVDVTVDSDAPYQPVDTAKAYTIRNTDTDTLDIVDGQVSANHAAQPSSWHFVATGDGFYRIQADNGQVLGMDDASGLNAARRWGAAVTLQPKVGDQGVSAQGQQWSVQVVKHVQGTRSTATGQYRLVNRLNGLALSFTTHSGIEQAVAVAPQRSWPCRTSVCMDPREPDSQLLRLSAD